MANREKDKIAWNTAPVMARYRALKAEGMSGLEASRAVLKEALTVGISGDSVTKPVIKSHEEAKRGTRTGSENLEVAPLSESTDPSLLPKSVTQKTCNTCNKPCNNRGDVCNACRQRAYRERQA